MNLETPKKIGSRREEESVKGPKGEEAAQFCRICHRPFSVTYGNFQSSKTGYISTEKIYIFLFQAPTKKA